MSFNRKALPANSDGSFDFPIADISPANPVPFADGVAGQAGSATLLVMPGSTRSNECVPGGRKAINVEIYQNVPTSPYQWVGYRLNLADLARYNIDAIRSVIVNFQAFLPHATLVGVYSEVTDFSLFYGSSGERSREICNIPAIVGDSLVILVQNYDTTTAWDGTQNEPVLPLQVMFCNFNQEPTNGYWVFPQGLG